MEHGSFFWCDLTTYEMGRAQAFYADLLGWRYVIDVQPDVSVYYLAGQGTTTRAGLLEMPEKYRKMGMPCFWMSYIAVEDAERTVRLAQSLGGKVEYGPVPAQNGASIALIRDPLVAGFTICDKATALGGKRESVPGGLAWNALFVSDACAVAPFYEALLGWQITNAPDAHGAQSILAASGREEASLYELPDAVRGKYQFWGVYFGVSDLADAKAKIIASGGEVVSEDHEQILAKDPDGAAFFLVPAR